MQTKIVTHLLIFAVLFIYCAVVFTPRNIPIFHTEVANAAVTSGIGLLGDSDTDEYRANDNRGGAFAATTLGWDEQLVKSRGLNLGAWGTWAGTRRTGYQYNWALSGTTTPNMIADGQHTGLAQQVASGEVSYALIYIGANDFNIWNGTYAEVYNGTLSDAALQAKVTTIIADITLAVDTLKSAGNVGVIIANYSDPGSSVSFMQQFPNSIQRQRVTNAILSINSQIQDLAASHGAVVADVYNFGNTLLGRINPAGKIIVGGEAIDVASMGDEPHHLQLGDSHPGTVASGLLANYFITQFNTAFNLNLAPLTDEEILINAGIHSTPTVTPVPTKSPTPAPTPVSMASVVSQYAQRKGSIQSGAISKVALDDKRILCI